MKTFIIATSLILSSSITFADSNIDSNINGDSTGSGEGSFSMSFHGKAKSNALVGSGITNGIYEDDLDNTASGNSNMSGSGEGGFSMSFNGKADSSNSYNYNNKAYYKD